MNTDAKIRFGIVGTGVILKQHLKAIDATEQAELTAVCDIALERAQAVAQERGVRAFDDYRAMMDAGLVDAVIIATPHRAHAEVACAAFERGLHVLTEKPLAADVGSARTMVDAARRAGTCFAVNFQMRANPLFQAARKVVQGGELGSIHRVGWTITTWFRTQFYYRSGGWRGTWAGEGGGVLLNQCPHQLDLFQWILGMPSRVRAFARYGRYHDISVEDDVTAYLEWANGATGVFITTTGEYPGINRLEIVGDRGILTLEKGRLTLCHTAESVRETIRTSEHTSSGPLCETRELGVEQKGSATHVDILRNFVAAIRSGEPLLAPGEEGVRSLELGNAMLLSSESGATIELPLASEAYARFLENRCAKERGKAPTA